MKSAKDKILAGEKGEHIHVPDSKRGNALTKSHELWMNPDTITKDSSATSGVYRTRRVAGTNSSKTNKE
jgi:hypothetical protein